MSVGLPLEVKKFDNVQRYNGLMDVVRNRMTGRAFVADYVVPDRHYEMVLEAARHSPSGANAQPWHYIVVKDSAMKAELAEYFMSEQRARAHLHMKFPTPAYSGMKTAPGLIVVVTDFRLVRAFPVLNDDSQAARPELAAMYRENAERILLQSVAASTMSAHLAAAALGYAVWWVTAIGEQRAQEKFKPLLGVPEEFAIVDIMCFGPPLRPSYKRWKKDLGKIMSWDKFNPDNYWSDEELDDWIQNKRSQVLYRDESCVD